MKLIKEQHPKTHAYVALNNGPKKYLEVYVTPANDVNDILHTGIIFNDLKLFFQLFSIITAIHSQLNSLLVPTPY
ncbi:MAG: hypothetical protein EXX96DRAFT_578792, partial [Benjaminiella poitrasii]